MSSEIPIVHIVDGDEEVRQSLALLALSEGWKPGVYRTAEGLLQDRSSLSTGCIVTELVLPGMDGIALLEALRLNGVPLPVVIVTGHADVRLTVCAFRKGAFHLIEKPYDPAEVADAVRAALAIEAKRARMRMGKVKAEACLARLTPREADVLNQLLLGQSSREIARNLGISPRTVEVYRGNIMVKTGADSLPDLVRLALEARPVQPSASWDGSIGAQARRPLMNGTVLPIKNKAKGPTIRPP
jgi:two-component system, LuxR family, response regulator FixJ